jgi:hypothetical protein
MPLPTLFIASSEESRPLVEALAEQLAPVAAVTPWYHASVFQPTRSNLENLLPLPARFDFGVFLFEPDERIVSGLGHVMTPSDNVVFELGLFMQPLGVERALAVAPRGAVTILSDLSGIQLFDYEESRDIRELRAALGTAGEDAPGKLIRKQLGKAVIEALGDRLTQMKELIQRQGPRPPAALGVEAVARSVTEVGAQLKALVSTSCKRRGGARVRHLGLDMSAAWDLVREGILEAAEPAQSDARRPATVTWRCLMINPDSPAIQEASSDSVDVGTAAARIKLIREYTANNRGRLEARGISFQCRLYSELPMMHGFLVEGAGLLWSMCGIAEGKLRGSVTPYWLFPADSPDAASIHPVQAFAEWFDHRWENGVDI